MNDWKFAVSQDGTSEGWEDASIKNFKGNPLNNLAREIIQNSLDAPKDPNSEKVVVRFKCSTISPSDIPGVDKLRDTVNACFKDAKTFVQEAKRESIAEAKRILSRPLLRLLSISESGTLGMKGPCEPGEPFYKYMKAKSQSAKDGDSKGSHGQGKAAPILCSNLHTIFASTIFEHNGTEESLVMGRASLSSHYDSEKQLMNNVGFWGDSDFKPVPYSDALPKWLKRDSAGTDIHIIAFNGTRDWEKILLASVASNFFSAVEQKKLEVEIGATTIDANFLPKIFEMQNIIDTLGNTQDVLQNEFINAKGLYEAFIAPEHIEFKKVSYFGEIKFYMKKREDPSEKHIGLIRNDMFITSNIPYLQRFSKSLDGFDVLIEPTTPLGCKLIRDMEPPAHNALSETWIDNPEMQKKGTTALKQLAKETKGLLEQYFGNYSSDSTGIEAFDQWFTIEDESGTEANDIDPTAGFKFIRKPSKPKSNATSREDAPFDEEDGMSGEEGGMGGTDDGIGGEEGGMGGTDDGIGGEEGGMGGEDDGTGSNNDDAEGIIRQIKESPVDLKNVRMIKLQSQELKLIFESASSGKLLLLVSEIGADTQRLLSIQSSSVGNINDRGLIEVEVEKGQKTSLVVETKNYSHRAIKLTASKVN